MGRVNVVRTGCVYVKRKVTGEKVCIPHQWHGFTFDSKQEPDALVAQVRICAGGLIKILERIIVAIILDESESGFYGDPL